MMILEFIEDATLWRSPDDDSIWVQMTWDIKNPELNGQVRSCAECLLFEGGTIEGCLAIYRDRYHKSLRDWVDQTYPGLYE